jgi:fumarate hydratase class I
MAGFVYQDPFALGKDETKFRLLEGSNKYVSVETFNGQEVLKVKPEGIKELANKAMREVSFLLRPAHNQQVAKIFDDPESSDNDK